MLDFRLPVTNDGISSNIIGMAYPENLGTAVETALISSLTAEIFRFLTTVILNFGLPVTCDNHLNCTVGLADPDDMGIADGISFLAGIEPEIYCL